MLVTWEVVLWTGHCSPVQNGEATLRSKEMGAKTDPKLVRGVGAAGQLYKFQSTRNFPVLSVGWVWIFLGKGWPLLCSLHVFYRLKRPYMGSKTPFPTVWCLCPAPLASNCNLWDTFRPHNLARFCFHGCLFGRCFWITIPVHQWSPMDFLGFRKFMTEQIKPPEFLAGVYISNPVDTCPNLSLCSISNFCP